MLQYRKPRRKQKSTDIVFHIRRALKKQRGSQFYYDYSDRNQGTYCGAPETAFDIAHKDLCVSWTDKQAHYVPCKECSKIRAFGGVK
jgi:hypothetical protein